MLVLSLGFILQLVPAVEHSFYCQICKLFKVICHFLFIWTDLPWSIDCDLVETILNKKEACHFRDSAAISKKLRTDSLNYSKLGGLKIPTKRLYFNPLILMHGGINKPAAVSFQVQLSLSICDLFYHHVLKG